MRYPQSPENDWVTRNRADPLTAGGRCSQPTGPVDCVTVTLVELEAEPFSPVQLIVNVTTWGVPGIATETEPDVTADEPLHPLKNGLLVRVQFKLLPKFDADQLMFVEVLTGTEPEDAFKVTDGPTPAVLTLATPVSGSIATALSLPLDVNCDGCVAPLSVQFCAETAPTTKADPSIDKISLLWVFIENPCVSGQLFVYRDSFLLTRLISSSRVQVKAYVKANRHNPHRE